MTRRILTGLLVAALVTAAPGIAYEALEKTAERLGPTEPLLALSLTAEVQTRWQPATGIFVVDRALHEIEETRHFWHLVGRRATVSEPERASAPAVAALVTVGR